MSDEAKTLVPQRFEGIGGDTSHPEVDSAGFGQGARKDSGSDSGRGGAGCDRGSGSDYAAFLARKQLVPLRAGLDTIPALNPALFPFQRETVEYLLRVGRGAAFLDTGLGKTLCQLEWARVVAEHTGRPVLILAPLAVAAQTVREGARFGIEIRHAATQADIGAISVTNYEKLDHFEADAFAGVVLDESSILKSFSGATKRKLCERFASTPFRLACTATPSPNDHMELGNHAEFLGVLAMNEMLQRWFVNDTSEASQVWRLKGHAAESFWDWVCSWAVCISKPSDMGDDDAGFALPPLEIVEHVIDTDLVTGREGTLFRMPDLNATGLHREKRQTLSDRAAQLAALIAAEPDEPWLLWCDTDYEADAITAAIPEAVEVRGSQSEAEKESRLLGFADGTHRILLTKPRIAGWGLNYQHCARVAFIGVSYSFEQFYQAVRRCWRFGQRRPVQAHVIMAPTEQNVWRTVTRKADDHNTMRVAMAAASRRATRTTNTRRVEYRPTATAEVPSWLSPS